MKRLIILFIKIYQLILSPILGNNKCRFYPTCSNYFIESVNKKGIIRGSLTALIRILKNVIHSRKKRL